jgi:hypothetical protein
MQVNFGQLWQRLSNDLAVSPKTRNCAGPDRSARVQQISDAADMGLYATPRKRCHQRGLISADQVLCSPHLVTLMAQMNAEFETKARLRRMQLEKPTSKNLCTLSP